MRTAPEVLARIKNTAIREIIRRFNNDVGAGGYNGNPAVQLNDADVDFLNAYNWEDAGAFIPVAGKPKREVYQGIGEIINQLGLVAPGRYQLGNVPAGRGVAGNIKRPAQAGDEWWQDVRFLDQPYAAGGGGEGAPYAPIPALTNKTAFIGSARVDELKEKIPVLVSWINNQANKVEIFKFIGGLPRDQWDSKKHALIQGLIKKDLSVPALAAGAAVPPVPPVPADLVTFNQLINAILPQPPVPVPAGGGAAPAAVAPIVPLPDLDTSKLILGGSRIGVLPPALVAWAKDKARAAGVGALENLHKNIAEKNVVNWLLNAKSVTKTLAEQDLSGLAVGLLPPHPIITALDNANLALNGGVAVAGLTEDTAKRLVGSARLALVPPLTEWIKHQNLADANAIYERIGTLSPADWQARLETLTQGLAPLGTDAAGLAAAGPLIQIALGLPAAPVAGDLSINIDEARLKPMIGFARVHQLKIPTLDEYLLAQEADYAAIGALTSDQWTATKTKLLDKSVENAHVADVVGSTFKVAKPSVHDAQKIRAEVCFVNIHEAVNKAGLATLKTKLQRVPIIANFDRGNGNFSNFEREIKTFNAKLIAKNVLPADITALTLIIGHPPIVLNDAEKNQLYFEARLNDLAQIAPILVKEMGIRFTAVAKNSLAAYSNWSVDKEEKYLKGISGLDVSDPAAYLNVLQVFFADPALTAAAVPQAIAKKIVGEARFHFIMKELDNNGFADLAKRIEQDDNGNTKQAMIAELGGKAPPFDAKQSITPFLTAIAEAKNDAAHSCYTDMVAKLKAGAVGAVPADLLGMPHVRVEHVIQNDVKINQQMRGRARLKLWIQPYIAVDAKFNPPYQKDALQNVFAPSKAAAVLAIEEKIGAEDKNQAHFQGEVDKLIEEKPSLTELQKLAKDNFAITDVAQIKELYARNQLKVLAKEAKSLPELKKAFEKKPSAAQVDAMVKLEKWQINKIAQDIANPNVAISAKEDHLDVLGFNPAQVTPFIGKVEAESKGMTDQLKLLKNVELKKLLAISGQVYTTAEIDRINKLAIAGANLADVCTQLSTAAPGSASVPGMGSLIWDVAGGGRLTPKAEEVWGAGRPPNEVSNLIINNQKYINLCNQELSTKNTNLCDWMQKLNDWNTVYNRAAPNTFNLVLTALKNHFDVSNFNLATGAPYFQYLTYAQFCTVFSGNIGQALQIQDPATGAASGVMVNVACLGMNGITPPTESEYEAMKAEALQKLKAHIKTQASVLPNSPQKDDMHQKAADIQAETNNIMAPKLKSLENTIDLLISQINLQAKVKLSTHADATDAIGSLDKTMKAFHRLKKECQNAHKTVHELEAQLDKIKLAYPSNDPKISTLEKNINAIKTVLPVNIKLYTKKIIKCKKNKKALQKEKDDAIQSTKLSQTFGEAVRVFGDVVTKPMTADQAMVDVEDKTGEPRNSFSNANNVLYHGNRKDLIKTFAGHVGESGTVRVRYTSDQANDIRGAAIDYHDDKNACLNHIHLTKPPFSGWGWFKRLANSTENIEYVSNKYALHHALYLEECWKRDKKVLKQPDLVMVVNLPNDEDTAMRVVAALKAKGYDLGHDFVNFSPFNAEKDMYTNKFKKLIAAMKPMIADYQGSKELQKTADEVAAARPPSLGAA